MFTSYAQNFEDVMLWRALKHIKNGFYIDVGAQDPIVDSVSRGFYEKGWRGVSVEPTSIFAKKLKLDRPDEDIQQCAVGSAVGPIPFFELPGTGLSTGDPVNARFLTKKGFHLETLTVPSMPLSELLDRYPGRDIHWLKIDVEGMELSVVESWGSSPQRPWIVVVENAVPLEMETPPAEWQELLSKRGYECCYRDGLNSFFVSEHKRELKTAFRYPPNLFDDFTLSGKSTSGMTSAIVKNLELTFKELQSQNERLDQAGEKLADTIGVLQLTQERVERIETSFSWMITAPYRAFSDTLKRASAKILSSDRRPCDSHEQEMDALIVKPQSAQVATNDHVILQTKAHSLDLTGEECTGLSRQSKLALTRLSCAVRTPNHRR